MASPLSRAEYFDERKLLIEARSRSYQRLEQMVSAGAAGALVFSITSLDAIIVQPRVGTRALLLVSWTSLLLSLAFSLAAQFLSGKAFTRQMMLLDHMVAGEADRARDNVWAKWNGIISIAGTILFLIGVALLALIAYRSTPFA